MAEWTEQLVVQHNGIIEDKKLKEYCINLYNNIQRLSDGFWKPVGLSYDENEIKITCEYVEGVRYG